MAGYTIQKRDLKNPHSVYILKTPTGSRQRHDSGYTYGRPIQETYSWRSRDEVPADIDGRTYRKLLLETGRDAYHNDQWDTGHEFYTEKSFYTLSHPWVNLRSNAGTATYEGPLTPRYVGTLRPTIPSFDVAWHGSRAIRETTPTRPHADLAEMIGELREGLPKIVGAALLKSQLRDFRSLGSEYLNIEFGWKPFVSGIMDLISGYVNAVDIMDQFIRDSGRNVRRKFRFPVREWIEEEEDQLSSYLSQPGNLTYFYSPMPVRRVSITTSYREEVWFSGCYTYFADPSLMRGDVDAYRKAQNILAYGLEITPNLLWNLAPWSWLADWIANVGDNLANMTRFQNDGLVLRYGYLMRHIVAKKTITQHGVTLTGLPGAVSPSKTWIVDRKERKRATPFGFGLNPNSFSARQWAILAALGMTRAPRTL